MFGVVVALDDDVGLKLFLLAHMLVFVTGLSFVVVVVVLLVVAVRIL